MNRHDVIKYNDANYKVLFTFDIENVGKSYAVIYPEGGNGQTDLEVVTYKYVGESLTLGTPTGEYEWGIIDKKIEGYFEVFG